MRLLLDTHALLWWLLSDPALSRVAEAAISSADEVWVSAVSALEVSTKVRIGKLDRAEYIARTFEQQIAQEGFLALPMTARHGQLAGNMAFAGKDPFDRTLIAQALLENLTLISNEKLFDSTGVGRIW